VGWWALDRSPADRLGANHGTPLPAPVAGCELCDDGPNVWDGGAVRQAYLFGGLLGNHDRIEVPDAPALNPGSQLTVAAWVLVTGGAGTYRTVAAKNSPGSPGYWLGVSAAGRFRAHVTLRSGATSYSPVVEGSTPAELDRWYHLAVVYDGNSLRLYVDGRVAAEQVMGVWSVATSTEPLRIGGTPPGQPPEPHYGLIDEVQLYNRALNPNEVASLHQALSAGICGGGTVTALAGGPYSANEGSPIAFTGSGWDPAGGAVSYSWDFTGDGVGDATGASASWSYLDNGRYTATLTVTNGTGQTATSDASVTVSNVAPTANVLATSPAPLYEGTAYTISLNGASDASLVDRAVGLTYAFDCGTGYGAFSTTASRSCPAYPDQGPFLVAGKVRDKDGGETEYASLLSVRNAAPVVSFAATSATSINSGQAVSFSGGFTDRGASDGPWTWTIVWGDGTPNTTGTATAQGGGVITASHTYTKAGSWQAYLTVRDKDATPGVSPKRAVAVARLPVTVTITPSPIDYSSTAELVVTILSTSTLDATQLSTAATSMTLGNDSGTETPIVTGSATTLDANGDGRQDRRVRFSTATLKSNGDLALTTTKLVLRATHADGRQVRGERAVTVVP
jgi:PKD repeat protein